MLVWFLTSEWVLPTLLRLLRDEKKLGTVYSRITANASGLFCPGAIEGMLAMNDELAAILNYMERERSIERETLIEAVEYALQAAATKGEENPNLRIHVDRETYDIKAYANKTVVDKAKAGDDEITVDEARKVKQDAEPGEEVEVEVQTKKLGRIAAQTAKQAIFQKIKQAEKERVYNEYKDQVGTIVSGAVRQFSRNDIIVDLGRAEAVIPEHERVPTEEYQVGDRIRGYILKVQKSPGGPNIILSRSHPNFVRKLFELEVAEIADGIVEVKGIAREPGYRTKISVVSNDEKVDPVGACVGMRGIRVKNIVRELSGEKIDIIRWHPDLKTYVANALSPAKLTRITVDPEIERLVHVIADAEQLSLAIGKKGQNVRLTSRLIDCKINVEKNESDVSFEEKVGKAVEQLAAVEGISRENAEKLVKSGFLTVDGILAAEVSDIEETAGLTTEEANAVYQAASKTQPGGGDVTRRE